MAKESTGYVDGAGGFGGRLGVARRGLGDLMGRDVSKAEIGERLGVSGQTVGQWERGETKTDIETIEKLAALLRVNPAWLAFGVGPQRLATPTSPVEPETLSLDNRPAHQLRGAESPPARRGGVRRKGRGA